MQNLFNDYVQSLETYIMFRIKETVVKITPELVKKNRKPILLSMGAPTANPPKKLIEDMKSILEEEGIHVYSTPKGEISFRQAIVDNMRRKFNVSLDKDTEVFSLLGSKEGLANLIRVLINPTTVNKDKDIILVPDPGYASYKEMVKVSGGKAVSIPLLPENDYMPDLDELYAKISKEGYNINKIKALLINYPNNPLGATATLEYLKKVVDFCKKHSILLISDAAYIDMYFKPELKPHSILEIEGAKDIAVEFYSFSKPYAMTGWRLGWVCGNKDVIKFFGKLKSTLDSGIFKALQKAGANILNSQEGDEYIKQANKIFKQNQDYFVKALKTELNWADFNVPDATFYLWLPIPKRYKTATEFTDDLMYKSGVIAVPGDAFGDYGKGFFRISLVCSKENLEEVIKRMKEDGFYYK